jgi:hypothetical protein
MVGGEGLPRDPGRPSRPHKNSGYVVGRGYEPRLRFLSVPAVRTPGSYSSVNDSPAAFRPGIDELAA